MYVYVCVFQPVCNAGKGDGQQGCVLLGICTFGGPSERPKKKKKNLVTYVVFVMTLYKHVRVNESFFFKDYNKNIKSELFFIYFASTNFKILYLGQKPYPMFKETNISFSPG